MNLRTYSQDTAALVMRHPDQITLKRESSGIPICIPGTRGHVKKTSLKADNWDSRGRGWISRGAMEGKVFLVMRGCKIKHTTRHPIRANVEFGGFIPYPARSPRAKVSSESFEMSLAWGTLA